MIESISGKLSRKDDIVFYHKWGKTYAWRNRGVHTFTMAQVACQTRFHLASLACSDLLFNPELSEQLEAYKRAYAASSGYCRLRGFVMAELMRDLKEREMQENG